MSKCQNCGYLSQRVTLGGIPQGLIEVEEDARESGKLPTRLTLPRPTNAPPSTLPNASDVPVCFARKFRLDKEISEWMEKNKELGSMQAVLTCIASERSCDAWNPWAPEKRSEEEVACPCRVIKRAA